MAISDCSPKKAVKQLQRRKYGLVADGIYNENTRNFLLKILNR